MWILVVLRLLVRFRFVKLVTAAVYVVDRVTGCEPCVRSVVHCLFRFEAVSSVISPPWRGPFARHYPWTSTYLYENLWVIGLALRLKAIIVNVPRLPS